MVSKKINGDILINSYIPEYVYIGLQPLTKPHLKEFSTRAFHPYVKTRKTSPDHLRGGVHQKIVDNQLINW